MSSRLARTNGLLGTPSCSSPKRCRNEVIGDASTSSAHYRSKHCKVTAFREALLHQRPPVNEREGLNIRHGSATQRYAPWLDALRV